MSLAHGAPTEPERRRSMHHYSFKGLLCQGFAEPYCVIRCGPAQLPNRKQSSSASHRGQRHDALRGTTDTSACSRPRPSHPRKARSQAKPRRQRLVTEAPSLLSGTHTSLPGNLTSVYFLGSRYSLHKAATEATSMLRHRCLPSESVCSACGGDPIDPPNQAGAPSEL